VGRVEVTPGEFTFVFYDAATIEAIADKLLDDIGLDRPLRIEIDEATPLGRVKVASLDPLVVSVQGGAFEDTRRPRQLGPDRVSDSLGRVLMRARDRLDPAFGEPPADDELTLVQSVAWDAYGVGRLARVGYPAQRQRRLYHFRNRHGFTDNADRVFDRLWNAEHLTWADIEAACAETEESRTPVG
jgi:hypothetical protein